MRKNSKYISAYGNVVTVKRVYRSILFDEWCVLVKSQGVNSVFSLEYFKNAFKPLQTQTKTINYPTATNQISVGSLLDVAA